MSHTDANDYAKLKKALLSGYNYTEDDNRKRFREATPETEETSDAFVIRLKNYLAKWLELSGSSPENFDALVDLIVKEQFINACSEDLAMYLLESGPKDLAELPTCIWAQKYLITHKQQLGSKSKAIVQPRCADQKKSTQSTVEGSRSKRNLKKNDTEGSTNSDRAVYSAVCRAQSNDQIYGCVGKLNRRPVKIPRDTGCTGIIMDMALLPTCW